MDEIFVNGSKVLPADGWSTLGVAGLDDGVCWTGLEGILENGSNVLSVLGELTALCGLDAFIEGDLAV